MNYKFDNLNDKIPPGRKSTPNQKIIYRAQTQKRLQHRALIRRVTHSLYVLHVLPTCSRPHDAEIIDNKLKPRQNKGARMERSKSQKYDLFDHFTYFFLFFHSVQIKNELALPFMRREYLCDDKTPTSIKFNIFITFLFEHYASFVKSLKFLSEMLEQKAGICQQNCDEWQ